MQITAGQNGVNNTGWIPTFGIDDNSVISPAPGGAGYVVGDTLTLAGGGTLVVNQIGGGGSITRFNITARGNYTVIPTQPVSQTATSGVGAGATFNLSYSPYACDLSYGNLNRDNGNLFLGGEQPNLTYSGSESVFIGDRAGGNVSSGDFNVAVGHDALGIGGGVLFSTFNNTVVGTDALRNLTSGANNTVYGTGALKNATTPNFVSAFGLSSMANYVGAAADSGNSAFGYQSMEGGAGTFTGTNNSAFGESALFAITTGGSNTATGYNAGENITTGGFNVFTGASAGQNITTGGNNTALGVSALLGAVGSTAARNVAIGQSAGQNATSANQNVIVGQNGAPNLTNGHDSIYIGYLVAQSVTTGSRNLIVGVNIDVPAAASADYMNIGGILITTGKNAPPTAVSTITGPTILSGGFTVAGLPAAAVGLKGARAYVTDALAPTYLGALVGGGAIICPVFCNGTAWVSA